MIAVDNWRQGADDACAVVYHRVHGRIPDQRQEFFQVQVVLNAKAGRAGELLYTADAKLLASTVPKSGRGGNFCPEDA